jgi:hypothetical protein
MRFSTLIHGAAMAAVIGSTAPLLSAVLPSTAMAQNNPTLTNVVPESAAVIFVAKIRSIDRATREVVLVGRSGTAVRVIAGPAVRLEMLKPDDTVNVKYYRSIAFAIAAPQSSGGAAQPDASMTAILARPAEAPGGVGVRLTKVSGLVVGIDMAAHSVDLVPPSGGGVYTIVVTNPQRIAALSQLRVGDTVTAAVSEALAVSIEPAR